VGATLLATLLAALETLDELDDTVAGLELDELETTGAELTELDETGATELDELLDTGLTEETAAEDATLDALDATLDATEELVVAAAAMLNQLTLKPPVAVAILKRCTPAFNVTVFCTVTHCCQSPVLGTATVQILVSEPPTL